MILSSGKRKLAVYIRIVAIVKEDTVGMNNLTTIRIFLAGLKLGYLVTLLVLLFYLEFFNFFAFAVSRNQ